ncbi:Isochorismatase hydrolase [Lenzites betulinus]|nr:Isochorismatase hydrolase [Lenzites betulinus]
MTAVSRLIPGHTVFLVCDIQTRLRSAVYGFDHVVSTARKMFRLAKVLQVPVLITEQNPRALGGTVPELDPAPLGKLFLGAHSKTDFSMAIEPVLLLLKEHDFRSVVLFGVESHICVLQTALDLLEGGYDVHVLADGVSSCHRDEVGIALSRMRHAGAQITTSESAAFELQVDAAKSNFGQFSKIIVNERDNTAKTLEMLVRPQLPPYGSS